MARAKIVNLPTFPSNFFASWRRRSDHGWHQSGRNQRGNERWKPAQKSILDRGGRSAAMNSQQIQSDLSIVWFPAGCCHGQIQSDLPFSPVPRRVAAMERCKVIHPSLLKRARLPSVRPSLAFQRSPLESLLLGSSLPHSWWPSSRPSILGSPRLVSLLAVLLIWHLLVLLHLFSYSQLPLSPPPTLSLSK